MEEVLERRVHRSRDERLDAGLFGAADERVGLQHQLRPLPRIGRRRGLEASPRTPDTDTRPDPVLPRSCNVIEKRLSSASSGMAPPCAVQSDRTLRERRRDVAEHVLIAGANRVTDLRDRRAREPTQRERKGQTRQGPTRSPNRPQAHRGATPTNRPRRSATTPARSRRAVEPSLDERAELFLADETPGGLRRPGREAAPAQIELTDDRAHRAIEAIVRPRDPEIAANGILLACDGQHLI